MLVDIAVCLPREAETVPMMRAVIGSILSPLGVTAICVDDLRLAISEACNNVIQHAAADDEYEVRVEVDERSCTISVTNSGEGFDAASLDGQMPDASSARGRGVALMHALVDHMDLRSEPDSGTIVQLTKVLSVEPGSLLERMR